jgi:hypothetical protein
MCLYELKKNIFNQLFDAEKAFWVVIVLSYLFGLIFFIYRIPNTTDDLFDEEEYNVNNFLKG